MTHILSIVSSKGGTGKTTVALNLAVALAEGGNSTLLIDIDPLGAIGFSLARSDTEWRGVAEYLLERRSIDDVIMPTKLPELSLLPRGRLDPLDVTVYEELLLSSSVLSDVIASVEKRYSYIIIDTPSGLGKVTRAALAVSNFVLLPLQAEALALRSITQTLRVLSHVKEHENPGLELLGILATMVQMNKDVSFNIITTVWESLRGVLETYIPRADIYSIASEKGLPVAFLPGQISPEAARFQFLVTELKGLIQGAGGVEGGNDERAQRDLV